MQSLLALSQEIVDHVCQSLSLPDIIHLALTSRQLYLAVSGSSCWNKVRLTIPQFQVTVSPLSPEYQCSQIDASLAQAFRRGLLANAAPRIRELSFDNTEVTPRCLDVVFEKCTQLRSLSLLHCPQIDIVGLVSFFQKSRAKKRTTLPELHTLRFFGHPTEGEVRRRYAGYVSWLLPALRNALVRYTGNPHFHLDILSEHQSSPALYCRNCGEGRCQECYAGYSIRPIWCDTCQAYENICDHCVPPPVQHYGCLKSS
ncbi:hypothetical protein K493DRAFT_317068 [Basidiobolus meristosporus CBS 931.73]|uniref:F-box domain-containing protein n=1 Tax=Basidiobolus meristosporus CBS 931.73 TaxID=1314790 RepID=A0A1Y1Y198_9FUNG|nr:hypothetical protein K493DRAFT_317068 [Basidiobolus meristosporus CBS 931.73]|eukprot:ORX91748.1 hypothetical protein K493DRAFT_317068 [Basidiobolus meristosporus CBS 931.73]